MNRTLLKNSTIFQKLNIMDFSKVRAEGLKRKYENYTFQNLTMLTLNRFINTINSLMMIHKGIQLIQVYISQAVIIQ